MTTPPALMDSTPQNFYTYYSMLRSEPAQIPILLRFLHEQRSPEREGLAVTVTSCLTGGSIISAAQWNALLAAGLHRVYMDIILTDEIYHDVRVCATVFTAACSDLSCYDRHGSTCRWSPLVWAPFLRTLRTRMKTAWSIIGIRLSLMK